MLKQSSFLASSIDNGVGAIVSVHLRESVGKRRGGVVNEKGTCEFRCSTTDGLRGYIKYSIPNF
jgi:hypothetical protein